MEPLRFLFVTGAMFAVDMLFAFYTRRTAQGKAAAAGIFACLILLFSSYVVTSYVENRWYLIAAVVGSFLGTYITVRFDKSSV